MNIQQRTLWVKQKAEELGFISVGISKAEFMDAEARKLEAWFNQNKHGKMNYLEKHFDKRVDPTKLVPGAKTVISLAYNYYPEKDQADPKAPKIARYAYGDDYHWVLKPRLKTFLQAIQSQIGEVAGRCFVDSAPILERDWAKRSGLGWIGKNTLLIHPKKGSYFFLAEIIVDLELIPDEPMKDFCGTCTKCIDACPTDAIDESGFVLDANKCISYLNIELKETIPDEFKGKMENWAFGCDICQEVCPWNRFSQKHQEPAFEPREGFIEMQEKDWKEITEEVFHKIFRKSAVKRAMYKGLVRNLKFLKE